MGLIFRAVEAASFKTGIPLGGLWLLLLTACGGLWVVTEHPYYTQRDLVIGFCMWAVAYSAIWLAHRGEFWMDPKLLRSLRDAEQINFERKKED
ncbi:hypothetical protein SAMN04488118_10412 [Epibacterium ulvae]|uniref:Uncharacterized protein n=1 Tax=Epibacterium ulvae TaxID=1156985 RepID=A0A1G5QFH7_9RHOB|nr:hypothetical protein [Epibacterium ulvae]SCZ59959.1 hypothetical protein SAMN04488118_10412 [Epibacterium ulvae]